MVDYTHEEKYASSVRRLIQRAKLRLSARYVRLPDLLMERDELALRR